MWLPEYRNNYATDRGIKVNVKSSPYRELFQLRNYIK